MRRSLALGVLVAVLGFLPWVAAAPPAGAWLTGPGGVESFAINGTWHCTNAGCTTIAGAGPCLESEVEWWAVTPFPVLADFAAAVGCSATYNGTLAPICVGAVCVFTGNVNVTVNDGSDPGYTIGPIPVRIAGAMVFDDEVLDAGRAHIGDVDGVLAAADQYTVNPLLVWSGAGALHGHCQYENIVSDISTCTVAGVFDLVLTGVEV